VATIMWACWDGGGNLSPSLGIAKALEARGHDVRFYGRPDMVERTTAAGLSASALRDAWRDVDRYSFHPLATIFGYTSSPAVGAEMVEIAMDIRPDVVVIDAMLSAALQVAPQFPCPTAIMLHTFFHQHIGMWQANFAMQSESRVRAGFDPLDDLGVLWGQRDLLHVNALRAFDGYPAVDWGYVVHGAPVLDLESRANPVELPWDGEDRTPIVLLSFSTVVEQRDPRMLQQALDALSPLPVHVVATTGSIVDPVELNAPDNAWITPFADHDQLMALASFVVGHGGHGTTMRAIRRGLPIIGIPAKGGDQAPNLALVESWGAGIALPGDADTPAIRAAARRLLDEPAFAEEAARRSRSFEGAGDGATLAADSIETLLSKARS
jgi:UDP:flavonoid glycosyltransferase YjiC (YdhE family)